jgi:hypothetical protein
MTKKPTKTLSIMAIANTASGYSSGVPDSSYDWNSGNVPSTNVRVEIKTIPKEVKAMIWKKKRKVSYIALIGLFIKAHHTTPIRSLPVVVIHVHTRTRFHVQ